MAAVAPPERTTPAPVRTLCDDCGLPVLIAVVELVTAKRRHKRKIIADPFEWEPRTRCYVCKNIESRSKRCPRCKGLGCDRCDGSGTVKDKRGACDRCGGEGYVGRPRPQRPMLAIDIAWSDEGHVRLLSPTTKRSRGEALYEIHVCDKSAIIGQPEPD